MGKEYRVRVDDDGVALSVSVINSLGVERTFWKGGRGFATARTKEIIAKAGALR